MAWVLTVHRQCHATATHELPGMRHPNPPDQLRPLIMGATCQIPPRCLKVHGKAKFVGVSSN